MSFISLKTGQSYHSTGSIIVTSDGKLRIRGYVTNPQVDVEIRKDGKLNVKDVTIDDYDVSRNSQTETFDYVITVEVPKDFDEEEILSLIEYDASLETMK